MRFCKSLLLVALMGASSCSATGDLVATTSTPAPSAEPPYRETVDVPNLVPAPAGYTIRQQKLFYDRQAQQWAATVPRKQKNSNNTTVHQTVDNGPSTTQLVLLALACSAAGGLVVFLIRRRGRPPEPEQPSIAQLIRIHQAEQHKLRDVPVATLEFSAQVQRVLDTEADVQAALDRLKK